ncbi:MAG: DUF5655 domain-containing protein [Anaerolineae bacterium]
MQATDGSLDTLFAGRPACRELYDAVERFIQSLGPMDIRVTQTQVAFAVKRQFAWVWMPQLWTRGRPTDSIVVSFALKRRVEHPRIAQSVEPYPGRWMHHVMLEDPAELDDTLLGWLTEAYAVGRVSSRKKKPG